MDAHQSAESAWGLEVHGCLESSCRHRESVLVFWLGVVEESHTLHLSRKYSVLSEQGKGVTAGIYVVSTGDVVPDQRNPPY